MNRLIGKKYKVERVLILIVVSLFSVLEMPFVRRIIIFLAEKVMSRQVDEAFWMPYLLSILFFSEAMFISLICAFSSLNNIGKKKTICIFVLLFFVISNFWMCIDGNQVGFFNYWDNGDFIVPVKTGYGEGSLYSTNYPPVAILFFRVLHMYMLNLDESMYMYMCTYLANIFIVITVVLFIFLSLKILGEESVKDKFFAFSLLFSSPVLFAFQRLNIMLTALVFTMLFLAFYKDERFGMRVVSYFSLALAANIKYFPAMFGLLLIKERRWKASFVCFALGIAMFFAPMIIPQDSIIVKNRTEVVNENGNNKMSVADQLKSLLKVTNDFATTDDEERVLELNLSVQTFVHNNLKAIGISSDIIVTMRYLILVIIVIVMTVAFFLTDRKDYELLILGLYGVTIVTTSNWYFMLFVIPGILEFVKNEYQKRGEKFLGILIISILVFQWGAFGKYIIQGYWHIYFLLTYIIVSVFINYIKVRRSRRIGNVEG